MTNKDLGFYFFSILAGAIFLYTVNLLLKSTMDSSTIILYGGFVVNLLRLYVSFFKISTNDNFKEIKQTKFDTDLKNFVDKVLRGMVPFFLLGIVITMDRASNNPLILYLFTIMVAIMVLWEYLMCKWINPTENAKIKDFYTALLNWRNLDLTWLLTLLLIFFIYHTNILTADIIISFQIGMILIYLTIADIIFNFHVYSRDQV